MLPVQVSNLQKCIRNNKKKGLPGTLSLSLSQDSKPGRTGGACLVLYEEEVRGALLCSFYGGSYGVIYQAWQGYFFLQGAGWLIVKRTNKPARPGCYYLMGDHMVGCCW
jgi:hypothetical protein